MWDVEREPGVEERLRSVPIVVFGMVAFHIDRLVEQGPVLHMPHSRALGDGLFELRFSLGPCR